MGHSLRINEQAFSRGVDEVLRLKPLRRALGVLLAADRGSPEKVVAGDQAVSHPLQEDVDAPAG